MRIVENSPLRLVMRDRTLWVSWICLAVAAAGVVGAAVSHQVRPLIPGALFAAFGVAFLRSSDVIFDKARRVCTLRRRDIGRVTTSDIPFSEITDVRVEPSPGGDDSGAINCRLSLVTTGGVRPLTASYQPSLERYNALRETLADALFAANARPAAADPVESLIAAGRSIDAIALLRRRDGLDLAAARDRVRAMTAEAEVPGRRFSGTD